jgi:hypothetical protein
MDTISIPILWSTFDIPLGSKEWGNLGVLRDTRCYVGIWDIPTRNRANGGTFVDNSGYAEQAIVRDTSNLADELKNLPTQKGDTIRIYIYELHGKKAFKTHLSEPPKLCASSSLSVHESGIGFKALTSQWRNVNPKQWCQLEGYEFFDSALQDGFDKKRGPSVKWAQIVKRILLREEKDGRLIGTFYEQL